jgi:hypothetical protein
MHTALYKFDIHTQLLSSMVLNTVLGSYWIDYLISGWPVFNKLFGQYAINGLHSETIETPVLVGGGGTC